MFRVGPKGLRVFSDLQGIEGGGDMGVGLVAGFCFAGIVAITTSGRGTAT